MTTNNRALFDIDADGTDQGADAALGATVHFKLRSTLGITSWILQVYNPAGFSYGVATLDNAPAASKAAPLLALIGDSTGQSVSKTPVSGEITAAMPGAGTHSWIVRSVVNGGWSNGKPDPSLVHERILAVRSVVNGLRKPIVTELRQFEDDSWAGSIADLVDAANDGGLAGSPGPEGPPGSLVDITSVITANVASLAAAPTSNDGYTFLNGDVLALAYQTTGANNRLYTSNGAGVLTPLSVQPPEKALLTVTKGNNLLNSLWKYTTGAVTLTQGGSSGVIQGVYTLTDFAPDANGLKQVTNPGIPRQGFTNDGSFHTIWSFDFVARGYTSGRLVADAIVWLVDGPKESMVTMRIVITCSATPPAGAPAAVAPADIIDDGAGPYLDARWFVVGTALCLQIKMLQSGTTYCVGIVGGGVGQ